MAKSNLFNDAVYLTFAKIVSIITLLAQGMILARALTKAEYGQYAQAMLIINFAGVFFSAGIPGCVKYFFSKAEDDEGKKYVLSQILILCFLAGFLCISFIVIFCAPLSDFFSEYDIRWLLTLGSVLPLTYLITSVFDSVYITINRAKTVAILRSFVSIIQVIAYMCVWLFDWGLVGRFLILVIIDSMVGIYSFFLIRAVFGNFIFRKIDFNLFKEMFAYSIPLMASNMMGFLNNSLGQIFITKLYGAEVLAAYALMTKELPIAILAASFTAVLVPRITNLLAKGNNKRVLILWNRTVEISYIITGWVVGTFIVLAPEYVKFLFSEKYVSESAMFALFSTSYMVQIVYLGMFLYCSGKTKWILFTSISSVVINAGLLYLLKPIAGIYAPVLSMVIAIYFTNVTQLILSAKIMRYSLKEIMPWNNLLKNFTINLVIGIILYFIMKPIRNLGIPPLLLLCSINAVWFVIIVVLNYKKVVILRQSFNTMD